MAHKGSPQFYNGIEGIYSKMSETKPIVIDRAAKVQKDLAIRRVIFDCVSVSFLESFFFTNFYIREVITTNMILHINFLSKKKDFTRDF